MARYINVDSALQAHPEFLNEQIDDHDKAVYAKGWNACNSAFYGAIKELPTVSPDEVRDAVCGVGKWILVDGIDEQAMARVHYIYCSKCGRQGLETRRGKDCYSHYCPHCGARLTGGEND